MLNPFLSLEDERENWNALTIPCLFFSRNNISNETSSKDLEPNLKHLSDRAFRISLTYGQEDNNTLQYND